MFKLLSLTTLALSAASAVHGAAIPRATVPSTYEVAILEPYAQYNHRYTALHCQDKHNTQFFDDCCHPLKIGETLEKNRAAYCNPANVSSASSVSSAPKPTETDDGEDCEDGEEDSSAVPSPTPSPATTHVATTHVATTHVTSTHVATTHAATTSPAKATAAPVNVAPEPPKESPSPSPSSSKAAAPSPSPTKASSSSGSSGDSNSVGVEIRTGKATWFWQRGVAGACGKVHGEDDKVVALDYRLYGDLSSESKYCGKSLVITNKSNGKQVNAIVADACPTCESAGSIDLSRGAFSALADFEVGEFDVSWHFTN